MKNEFWVVVDAKNKKKIVYGSFFLTRKEAIEFIQERTSYNLMDCAACRGVGQMNPVKVEIKFL